MINILALSLCSWTSCSAVARLSRGPSSIWWNLVGRIMVTRWTHRQSSVSLKYWPHTTCRNSACSCSSWLGHRDYLLAVCHYIRFHVILLCSCSDRLHYRCWTSACVRLRSHRHEYKYGSRFLFVARRSFTCTSGTFTVTCTSR